MEKQELILLVSALQKGKKDAAGPLYDAYYNDIYFFILKMVNDPHLASDLTQDTFVEVLESIEKLRIPSAFYSWCKMIAYYKCTTYFKKRKDILADEKKEGYYLIDKRVEERTEFLPDESIDQNDLKQTICGMLDALPEEQRAAILMRYYDQISVKDIATIQKVSEGTVKSRLNYGRKSIKESVIEYEKKNNIKLHCRGVVPLLLWFFHEDRLAKGISLTDLTPLAKTVATFAEKTTRTVFKKIVTAIAASLILTTGISGATKTLPSTPSDVTLESEQDVSTELEDSELIDTITTESNSEIESSEQLGETEQETESEQQNSPQQPESSQPTTPQPPESSQQPENSQQPEAPSKEQPTFTLSSDGKYYIIDNMQHTTSSHITIPATYNGIPVTKIAASAFKNNIHLQTISIPNSIVSVGEGAFFSTGLTEITIPDSVTSIGARAFASCNSLESVTLSDNITTIETGAFSNCVSLKSITIPKNTNHIAEMAFGGCISLTSITVDSGNSTYHSAGNCLIETATKALVFGCKSSQIPANGSVTSINNLAFFGMTTLSTITIPEGITTIHLQAFDFCTNLSSIYLPASLKLIDSATFSFDEKLADIYYAGTMEQWTTTFPKAKYFLPEQRSCTIHCIDGNLTNP